MELSYNIFVFFSSCVFISALATGQILPEHCVVEQIFNGSEPLKVCVTEEVDTGGRLIGVVNCCQWIDGELHNTCCVKLIGNTCKSGYTTDACKPCHDMKDQNGKCNDKTDGPRPSGTNGVNKCCKETDNGIVAQCYVTAPPDDYTACYEYDGFSQDICG